VTLNGGSTLHGEVIAPAGTVTLNGNATVNGRVSADRLTLNGNAVLHEAIP
jgi:rhamnogalacturonan endolyase